MGFSGTRMKHNTESIASMVNLAQNCQKEGFSSQQAEIKSKNSSISKSQAGQEQCLINVRSVESGPIHNPT